MQRPRREISGPVLLVFLRTLGNRRVQRPERARPLLLQPTLHVLAL